MSGPSWMPCPLQELARRQPAGIFVSTPGGDLSVAEAERRVDAAHSSFRDPASWQCLSEPMAPAACVIRILAGFRAGCPVALLNLRQPAAVRAEQKAGLASAIRKLPLRTEPPPGTWNLRSPATLLYTSGSSGEARAVLHSLANHVCAARAVCEQAPLGPGDRWLCPLPLYHVGGLAILFRCLLSGATLCFPDKEESLAHALRRCRPTHLSLVPTQLRRWMRDPDFDPSGLKRVLIGGAELTGDLRRAAEAQGLPLAVSYGMTETASQVAATPPGEAAVGAGRPLGHARLRIAENGEILIKGPCVAMGLLLPDGIAPLTDAEGWLHTRDIGSLEEGLLRVEGRMDFQFISGGENIQPEQIERALLNCPGIREAVVVPQPDPDFGHRPVAWVDATLSGAEEEALNLELRKSLPGYMIPVGYRTLPEATGLKRNRKDLGLHIRSGL